MAYPNYTTPRSIPGAATPTYLTATLASGYSTSQTFTVASTANWYEVSTSGTATTNPLGTSGVFTLVVDYGLNTEEKILCSGVITIGTNVPITVWYDGTHNGRGWDGTLQFPHAVGSGSNPNIFPVRTAVDDLQFNNATAYIATLSGNQVTDETNIATLSGTLNTVSGVAYAALPRTGGTISGNLVVASGLTVSGTTTINNNLVVASGLTISGTITETGTTIVTQTGGAFSNDDDQTMTIMGAWI